ncbi:hypothetical protein RHGRI_007528 [Rhododendron griersonianum]|uniref:Uncharacterized protein n=1 Tax=Rhododendron griersonianum TaxID=479676 RepID=A0AAV6KXW0_9ERIC|nr:hypothetical protein RHGRI_007528 [Rhododendron griersonianum]
MVPTTSMVLKSLTVRILSMVSSSVRLIAPLPVTRGLISCSPFTYLRSQPNHSLRYVFW